MARRNTLSKRLADLDSKPKSSGPPMPGQRQEDDKPIDGVVFVMMNLIVLFGIIVAAVFFGTNSIESSIENEIADTLKANGVTEVEVIATGIGQRSKLATGTAAASPARMSLGTDPTPCSAAWRYQRDLSTSRCVEKNGAKP